MTKRFSFFLTSSSTSCLLLLLLSVFVLTLSVCSSSFSPSSSSSFFVMADQQQQQQDQKSKQEQNQQQQGGEHQEEQEQEHNNPWAAVSASYRSPLHDKMTRNGQIFSPLPSTPAFDFFQQEHYKERMKGAVSLAVDCNQGFNPCAPHGSCSSSRCVCDSEPLKGFWSGDDCKECDVGWSGQECKIECKGGACNRCNGHGTCSEGVAGDGTCTCDSGVTSGFYDGADCSRCKAGYFGDDCDKSCPGAEFGQLPCWGRGECQANDAGEGFCVCDPGWGTEHGCSDCDISSFGSNCVSKCDGTNETSKEPCAGHGRCFNGTTANGTCICDATYGTWNCSTQCPGQGCGGHGTCDDGVDGAATCTCKENWSPPGCTTCVAEATGWDCQVLCPFNPVTGLPCSLNGECIYVNNASECRCAPGYAGSVCETVCPGNPPCSGHGTCFAENLTCSCHQNPAQGYWAGELCDRCDLRYNNSLNCSVKCPAWPGGGGGSVCNGHGQCFDGVCVCDRFSSVNPFEYCGTACEISSPPNIVDSNLNCIQCTCEYCTDQFAAGDCVNKVCPAVSSTDPAYACTGHGRCREGRGRSGGCFCYTGFAGDGCQYTCPVSYNQSCGGYHRGICNATYNKFNDVTIGCDCRHGFAGLACEIDCPRVGDLVCNNHGDCNGTRYGDGTCICHPGWTGRRCDVPCTCNIWNGVCDMNTCIDNKPKEWCSTCKCFGNYTGLCNDCIPGVQGRSCEGSCVHGNTSGKICLCDENWSGAGCDIPCPRDAHNGTICGSRGKCLWGNTQLGLCECETNWFGLACTEYCDPNDCVVKENLVNPQCNVLTGKCECQDNDAGHWSGDRCDVCVEGYFGTDCEQRCACSNHGSCDKNSGECSCFQSVERGFYSGQQCDVCTTGYIGTNCERKSVGYTRVDIDDPQGTPNLQASPHIYGGIPPTDVLFMDERLEKLYAGGFPLVLFDANLTEPGVLRTLAQSSTAPYNNTLTLADGNTTLRKCYDEVAYVFAHENYVYYLMHPQMQCNVTARLMRQLRVSADLNLTDGGAELVWTMPYPSTWPRCVGCATWGNRTTRVVAAHSLSDMNLAGEATYAVSGEPLLVFIMAQPAPTVANEYEGSCILVHIKIDLIASLSTRDTAVWAKYLPPDYDMSRIQVRHAFHASDTSEKVLVSGKLLGQTSFDTWETLEFYFREGSGFEPQDVTEASLRTKIECWPLLSDLSRSLRKCDACSKVGGAFYMGRSIVMGINHPESVFAVWIRPFEDVAETKSFDAVIRGKCEAVTYDKIQRTIRGKQTGIIETHLPAMIPFIASAAAPGTDIISMMFDASVNQLHLSLTVFPTSSLIIKFTLADNELAILGSQTLGFVSAYVVGGTRAVPETFSRMMVDEHARVMYCSLLGVSPIKFAGFLLYDARVVTPNIADQRGGTTIIVNGTGYHPIMRMPPPGVAVREQLYEPRCSFSNGDTVKVREMSKTGVVCVTTQVSENDIAASCAQQTVEISLFGEKWFTLNLVALRRVRAAKIESAVFPERGGFKGMPSITFSGSGFIDSPFARCRFSSNSTNPKIEKETLTSTLHYIDRNSGWCPQPAATLPSPDWSFLDVSLDGQLFMETTPPFYTIVGSATNVSSPAIISLAAKERTPMSIRIDIVDELHHWVGPLDDLNRTICVSTNVTEDNLCEDEIMPWRFQGDGYPWPPCRPNYYELKKPELGYCRQVDANVGFVNYPDLDFVQPRVGDYNLRIGYTQNSKWVSVTIVRIVPGKPAALALSNRRAILERPSFIKGVPLSPAPEIIVLDKLGNKVTQPPEGLEVIAIAYYIFDSNKSSVTSKVIPVKKAPDSEVVRFPAIYLDYLYGVTHFVRFESIPVLDQVTTPPLRPVLCDNAANSYKVPSSSQCKPCPPEGAVCNGTEVILVLPGYWRGNSTTDIYKCKASEFICLGALGSADGSMCAEGYHGPMCSLCIHGWGKAGSTKCQPCPAIGSSIAIIVVTAVLIIMGLTGWTINVLRQPKVTDLSIIMRTIVNHMQATGKLGEFSTQWDPFLKGVFDIQNSASGLNFSGLSAISCIISLTGNDYQLVFIGYMMLPSITVIMTGLVLGTVRALKLKPVLTDKLRADVIEEVKNMPSARIGVLLEKYPWYMVATTTISIFMFTLYQTLITQATAVLTCRELVVAPGKTQQYLAVDMSIECDDSGDHKFKTAAYIAAVAYGVGIPSAFVFGYRVVLQSLGNKDLVNMMFQFLVGGYKPQFWYWQAVIMVRKLVLVLVITFIGENAELQSYGGMWTMAMALVLQIWFEPNERDVFNRVEALSLAIITITLNLGLLYFWDKMPQFGKNVLTAFLILVTMGVVVMFAYYMYEPLKDIITEKTAQAKMMLKQYIANRKIVKEDTTMSISDIKPDYKDDDEDDGVTQWHTYEGSSKLKTQNIVANFDVEDLGVANVAQLHHLTTRAAHTERYARNRGYGGDSSGGGGDTEMNSIPNANAADAAAAGGGGYSNRRGDDDAASTSSNVAPPRRKKNRSMPELEEMPLDDL